LYAQTFRDRVAVTFIVLAVVVGSILGVATIRSYTQPQSTLAATNAPGTDNGAVSGAGNGASAATGSSGGSSISSGGGSGISAPAGSTSEAASGVAGGTITVGGFFDETGAVDSTVERDTVKSYLQRVNDSGGINGRKFQFIDCDSKYDSTAAHVCAENLISQKILAVVGWTAPQGENNEVKTFNDAGIPMIGGLGTPDEYRYPLSYPVSTPFTRYGTAIGAEAAALGIKHPAVVVIHDVPWVAPVEANLLQSINDNLRASGGGYTDVEEVSATQPTYQGTVFNLQHSHNGPSGGGPAPVPCSAGDTNCPDAVIAALDPFSYKRLFDSMAAASWHPKVLGGGLDKGSVQRAYGTEVYGANSLVPFLSPYDHPSNPTVAAYLGSVNHYYPNQVPALDIYTQHSWTAAMVFIEAVKRAGPNLDRASLIAALNSIQNFDTGWSTPLSYGAGTHDPNHCFTYTHDNAPNGTWTTTSGWKCYP
jgi:ABC-type branched-subunit amino acid transport system substrate-binding protein